jgi:hypothetical protein
MNNHISCRGEVRVALPVEDAIELFTPEGERAWDPAWDPRYPDAQAGRRATGTVFLTHAGERTTTWVIVESSPNAMRYARVTPGVQAGTVSVRCRPEDGATVAEVGYDVTALSEAAAGELAAFAAAYADEMAEWERDIAAALAAHA